MDQLCNVDFSYLDLERGLVGETWLANIELEGELDEQGMVCDFGQVKALMRCWLDENIDHRLVIPEAAAALTFSRNDADDSFLWQSKVGLIEGRGPHQAHCIIGNATEITQESVAAWCIQELQKHFPNTVAQLRLNFSTEIIAGPFYHYSHGLKKHDGNCQRIAHGHRSKIEIWKNGEVATELMENWAKRWADIYIGTDSDLCEAQCEDRYAFSYEAQQGTFALSLPKEVCYLIHSDSTVELIAKHILDELTSADPHNHYRVKAYEGISKGAIADSGV